MTYISPTSVNDIISSAGGVTDVRGISMSFYSLLRDMLSSYGNSNTDLVLPNGQVVAKELKYDWYGTYMFSRATNDLSSVTENTIALENSIFTLEKTMANARAGA